VHHHHQNTPPPPSLSPAESAAALVSALNLPSFTDTYTKSVITTIEPRVFGAEAEYENRLRAQQQQHGGGNSHLHSSAPHSPATSVATSTNAIDKLFKSELLNGIITSNGGRINGAVNGDGENNPTAVVVVSTSGGEQIRMQSVITSCDLMKSSRRSSGGQGHHNLSLSAETGSCRDVTGSCSDISDPDTIIPTLHSSIESYLSAQENLAQNQHQHTADNSFNSSGIFQC
jgi:hypothetical protein